MPNRTSTKPKGKTAKLRPASTPEERENQMIALAYDLAEQRLLEGTATSQEIVHFLKLGSTKERLEKQILEQQNELMEAKTEAIRSERRIDEMYARAMKAFSRYSGTEIDDEED